MVRKDGTRWNTGKERRKENKRGWRRQKPSQREKRICLFSLFLLRESSEGLSLSLSWRKRTKHPEREEEVFLCQQNTNRGRDEEERNTMIWFASLLVHHPAFSLEGKRRKEGGKCEETKREETNEKTTKDRRRNTPEGFSSPSLVSSFHFSLLSRRERRGKRKVKRPFLHLFIFFYCIPSVPYSLHSFLFLYTCMCHLNSFLPSILCRHHIIHPLLLPSCVTSR